MKNMIVSFEDPGFFYGEEVTGLFDNAYDFAISPGVCTNRARVGFRKGKTVRAKLDRSVKFSQGICQLQG